MAQEQIKKGDWVRYMDDPPFQVSENETPEKIAFMNTDSSYEKVTGAAQKQTRKGDGWEYLKKEESFSGYNIYAIKALEKQDAFRDKEVAQLKAQLKKVAEDAFEAGRNKERQDIAVVKGYNPEKILPTKEEYISSVINNLNDKP